MESPSQIKLREPLLVLVAAVLLIWWGINAFNTGNVLWFLPLQPVHQPSRIIVRDYGTAVTLQAGTAGYDELTEALNQSLGNFANRELIPIGLGEETLRRYHEEELVLEVYYPEPVRFNTSVRLTGVNQLLIPIDATHDGQGYVFIGSNGQWRVGAMVMENDEPLMEAMGELGYLEGISR
jgi:hypothetical protein